MPPTYSISQKQVHQQMINDEETENEFLNELNSHRESQDQLRSPGNNFQFAYSNEFPASDLKTEHSLTRLTQSQNRTCYSTKLFDKIDLELVHGTLYNESTNVLVNLNDEFLQSSNQTSQELIVAGGESIR